MRRTLQTLLIGLAVIGVAALVVVAGIVVLSIPVHGRSMEPTVHSGDRLFADPTGFSARDARLHVVIGQFREGGQPVVKRVIAIPGDRVRIEKPLPVAGRVFVQPAGTGPWFEVDNPAWVGRWSKVVGNCCTTDGKASVEPMEQTVPDGKFFVLGDNLVESDDSRTHGWLDATTARGIARWRVFPLTAMGALPSEVRLIPSS